MAALYNNKPDLKFTFEKGQLIVTDVLEEYTDLVVYDNVSVEYMSYWNYKDPIETVVKKDISLLADLEESIFNPQLDGKYSFFKFIVPKKSTYLREEYGKNNIFFDDGKFFYCTEDTYSEDKLVEVELKNLYDELEEGVGRDSDNYVLYNKYYILSYENLKKEYIEVQDAFNEVRSYNDSILFNKNKEGRYNRDRLLSIILNIREFLKREEFDSAHLLLRESHPCDESRIECEEKLEVTAVVTKVMAGPNEVTENTDTDITGIIKGNGSKIRTAVANVDYQPPISDLQTIREGAALGATAYQLPNTGVPKSDLSAGVKHSLDLADTALQEHQSLAAYRKSADQDVIDNALDDKIDTINESLDGRLDAIEAQEATWNGKQDYISDLSTIRSGAALGATAYQKSAAGIPKADLTTSVQASLNLADSALQEHQSLAAYRTGASQDIIDNVIREDISDIEALIPSQATSSNQLADKSFVNSSIATETATFRGTSSPGLTEAEFLAWANTLPHDNNDYIFWNTTDSDGNVLYKKYKFNGTIWEFEYTLNNSSFTVSQWSAINSGATSTIINSIAGKYVKPTNGIPKSDLDSSVQSSLDKADTALQTHQDISGKENISNKTTSLSSSSTDTQYPSAKAVYDTIEANEQVISEHITSLTTNKEDKSNKVVAISSSSTDAQYPSAKCVYDQLELKQGTINDLSTIRSGAALGATSIQSHQDISGKEDKTNKVTAISSSSTDTEYPSAKCVYDIIGDIETLLSQI